jgi:uncharacterized protein
MMLRVFCCMAAFSLAACGAVREEASWRAQDGTEIHGRLHLPADARGNAARYPLVIFVNGSGRTPALEVGVVRAHANELARRGFAVLTYDKRGTGGTGGAFPASFDLMADDLIAGAAWARRQPRIDANRTSVVAISQGWWVTAIAVDRGMRVRSLVGIGAPSVSPIVQQEHVMASEMTARGASAQDIEQARSLLRQWAAALRGETSRADYERSLEQARAFDWFAPMAEQLALWPEGDPYGAWYRSIMDFDPAPLLRRNDIPVTIFQGDGDEIVSPDRSAADYRALRAEGAPIDFRVIGGASHDLSHRNAFGQRAWSSSYWDALDKTIRASSRQ